MRLYGVIRVFVIVFSVVAAAACATESAMQNSSDHVYLFSYFRGNGETGLHLAYSEDGLKWTALNNNQSILKPEVGNKLMRDPSIVQGPDGTFHMVWTTGWWDNGIGLAHSKDLLDWSEQTFLPVMKHEPEAKNCWAPEITYDAKSDTFLICWATTIPGRFPETDHPQDHNNHRMYYIATQDFEIFTDTALFYEPGFNVIDTFIVFDEQNDRYAMFIKDERNYPNPQKNIRVAFSDNAAGPYGPPSEPIHGDYWAEGPSVIQIQQRWIVYFDKYTQQQYGAVASKDFVTWTDISDQVQFPQGTRHGTVFSVEREIFQNLRNKLGNDS